MNFRSDIFNLKPISFGPYDYAPLEAKVTFFPKYNIYTEDSSPNQTTVEISLPSTVYCEDDLEVLHENGKLIVQTVSSYKRPEHKDRTYYKKQIGTGEEFTISWPVKKSTVVENCYYADGILTIKLKFNDYEENKGRNLLKMHEEADS